MKIPCELIVRMSHIMQGWHDGLDPVFRTMRLENGRVIVTDRALMAIERVAAFEGVHHITIDDALLEQCRTESQYGGLLEIVANPALRFTMGKTTFGYSTGNIGYFGPTAEFDRWPEVIAPARTAPTEPAGVMVWNARDIGALAAASPSGVVEFPRIIDATMLAIPIRDSTTGDWCGFFHPKITDGKHYGGATVPGWV